MADVVMFVVDAVIGATDDDEAVVRLLRRSGKPVVLVANKVDDQRFEADAAALWNLGLGQPWPVSALHGRGSGDMLDAVLELPGSHGDRSRGRTAGCPDRRPGCRQVILLNKLAGEDRVVVDNVAGTTDPVDELSSWYYVAVRRHRRSGGASTSPRCGLLCVPAHQTAGEGRGRRRPRRRQSRSPDIGSSAGHRRRPRSSSPRKWDTTDGATTSSGDRPRARPSPAPGQLGPHRPASARPALERAESGTPGFPPAGSTRSSVRSSPPTPSGAWRQSSHPLRHPGLDAHPAVLFASAVEAGYRRFVERRRGVRLRAPDRGRSGPPAPLRWHTG